MQLWCPPTPCPPCMQSSELRAANEATMDALAAEKGATPLSLPSRYATRMSTQRSWLMKKFWSIYWHSPSYSERTA